ncbi:MAG: hypothetical protein HYT64_01745 [Candidatus Yanofskybacteria bacterium]|nr:hypothetical protein [Candidatus Yanofskybacteria bacterium]
MSKTRKWRELYDKMSPENKERIEARVRQESIEKLLEGLLKQEAMTTRQMVDRLMSETYREANITAQEFWLALLHLQEKKLLKLAGFSRTFVGSLDIEPLLAIYI